MKEKVLVFPAKVLGDLPLPNGLSREVDKYLDVILNPKNLLYLERDLAEVNPFYKQLIPYCVFRKGDLYFVYQRTGKGGEKRLHAKYSIACGGHISSVDGEVGETSYLKGMARELEEEIGFNPNNCDNKIIGIIYDSSNEVGMVHVGIVHMFTMYSNFQINKKENTMADCQFLSLSEIKKLDLENWSSLVIDYLCQVD